MKPVLIAMGLLLLAWQPVHAQLINVDKNYRITRVDYAHNRVEVQYLESKTATIFVDVDGHTQVLLGQKPFDWKRLMKDWIIQVKGGLSPDLHIKAKTIIVHST